MTETCTSLRIDTAPLREGFDTVVALERLLRRADRHQTAVEISDRTEVDLAANSAAGTTAENPDTRDTAHLTYSVLSGNERDLGLTEYQKVSGTVEFGGRMYSIIATVVGESHTFELRDDTGKTIFKEAFICATLDDIEPVYTVGSDTTHRVDGEHAGVRYRHLSHIYEVGDDFRQTHDRIEGLLGHLCRVDFSKSLPDGSELPTPTVLKVITTRRGIAVISAHFYPAYREGFDGGVSDYNAKDHIAMTMTEIILIERAEARDSPNLIR